MTLKDIIERAVLRAEGRNPLAACRQACTRAVREALELARLADCPMCKDGRPAQLGEHRVWYHGMPTWWSVCHVQGNRSLTAELDEENQRRFASDREEKGKWKS